MKIKAKIQTIAISCTLMAAGVVIDGWLHSGLIITEVQARLGRPLTPVSVAGVARRTTRRTIRRTSIYAATLPTAGCTKVVIEGTTLHQCGSTYYQAVEKQYVVVNVD